MTDVNYSPSEEDNDINKNEPHNPVEAGKKAMEADQLVNDKNKAASEQSEDGKADAEKWRNEG